MITYNKRISIFIRIKVVNQRDKILVMKFHIIGSQGREFLCGWRPLSWNHEIPSRKDYQRTSRDIFLAIQLIEYRCCCCVVDKSCPTLVTPWTVAHQAPLSMGFPRQEHWSGFPFPSPGDLPDPGIEPVSPAWQADCSSLSHLENPNKR